MQQLLPACFTTKRKLMGNGILRPTENLFLGKRDVQDFRIEISAIQLHFKVRIPYH